MSHEIIYARTEAVGPMVVNYSVAASRDEVRLSSWLDLKPSEDYAMSKQDAIETARAILSYFNEEL